MFMREGQRRKGEVTKAGEAAVMVVQAGRKDEGFQRVLDDQRERIA